MESINPADGKQIMEYRGHSKGEVAEIIDSTYSEWVKWKQTNFGERALLMHRAADILRARKDEFARLITLEMGKIIRESEAEVEKCAICCDYFANHAMELLQDEEIVSDAGRSFVTFQPLGIVLAVMPWNFPFWQVFRFAAPSLMAGNAALLKHASNVPGCALAIESVFREAGFPPDIFRTLMITPDGIPQVIDHPFVKAVTLTGSEFAGSQVASRAGNQIKKAVLELGGSDPFIVLDDADLDLAVSVGTTARMLNQGQSCIAAKRFIVMEEVADDFISRLKASFESLRAGDPLDPSTQVGPLARPDLVADIEQQVGQSVCTGATLVTGGKRIGRPGNYFMPTILDGVKKGMAVYSEETFGPVAAIIRVSTEQQAIDVANDSEFGLGGSVFTRDNARGERVARAVETGAMFVNGLTKSDPRLPFGGIGKSGYGRELGSYGIREFVNIKTIWIR